MKLKLLDLAIRIVMVLIFLLYPVFAIMALPWALFDSLGSWGHTSFRSWLEGWAYYHPAALLVAGRQLITPLGSNV